MCICMIVLVGTLLRFILQGERGGNIQAVSILIPPLLVFVIPYADSNFVLFQKQKAASPVIGRTTHTDM